MKSIRVHSYLVAFLVICVLNAKAQNAYVDSFKRLMNSRKPDTIKAQLMNKLSMFNIGYNADSAVYYAGLALKLSEKLNYDNGIFNAQIWSGSALATLGNYPLAVDYGLKALKLSRKTGAYIDEVKANSVLACTYFLLGDFKTSLYYDRKVENIVKKNAPDSLAFISGDFARIFLMLNKPDSSLFHAKICYHAMLKWHKLYDCPGVFTIIGDAWLLNGGIDSAMHYYKAGIRWAISGYMETDLIDLYNGIARVHKTKGSLDSAEWYAKKVLADKLGKQYPVGILKAEILLADIYQLNHKPDSALKYLKNAISLKDSLYNREKSIAVQNIVFKDQENEQELETAKAKMQNRFIFCFSIIGLLLLMSIAWISLKNKRLKQLHDMRNTIAGDLHDDIGSTLSSISIMSELAKAKSPEATPLLVSIEAQAINIQEEMSDIVWAVNPQNDRFEHVLLRMKKFASEILEAKGIELDFTSDITITHLKLSMDQRKTLYLFFKEAVNNAAKYSNAKRVVVFILQRSRQIEVIIQDDGKGFNISKPLLGNGLSSLKRRAADLSGDCKIQSSPGEGTTISLLFKIT